MFKFLRLVVVYCLVDLLTLTVGAGPGLRDGDYNPALGETIVRSTVARQVTGPEDQLDRVIATGGATMAFALTPVLNYPGGAYNTGGAYGAPDISGQTLTVPVGGFRSFWNLQVRDWNTAATSCSDTPRLRSIQMRINEDDFESGSGAPLTRAQETCVNTTECIADFGEAAPICSSGRCNTIWINKTRTDGLFHTSTRCDLGCGPAIWDQGQGALLTFGSADPPLLDGTPCAPRDRHMTEYFASIAIDVPTGAAGIYTIGFADVETFAFDDNQPVNQMIPLLAKYPGRLIITDVGFVRYPELTIASPPAEGASEPTAIEVELASLPRFVCSHDPTRACAAEQRCGSGNSCIESDTPFPHEGEVRYARLVGTVEDSEVLGTTMAAAVLSCEPDYRSWEAATAGHGGALYITGAEFVPRGLYTIRQLAATCQGIEETCTDKTDLKTVRLAGWGDVNGDHLLDVMDINHEVDALLDVSTGRLPKHQTQMQPNAPDPTLKIALSDLANVLDAIQHGIGFPHAGPCPCPSVQSCDPTTACISTAECPPGRRCVGGFCSLTDACGRCLP